MKIGKKITKKEAFAEIEKLMAATMGITKEIIEKTVFENSPKKDLKFKYRKANLPPVRPCCGLCVRSDKNGVCVFGRGCCDYDKFLRRTLYEKVKI